MLIIIMNTKVLIQTITQIPDIQLLAQLQSNLKNTGGIIVPDLNKLYLMFVSLLKCKNKQILFKSLLLLSQITKTLLSTQLQVCWRQTGAEIVRLGGVQDEQIRKKGRQTLFQMLFLVKNSLMFLETLYYQGLQSENNIVIASSIKIIEKIFQDHSNLLEHKTNIPIIKLIIQKLIRFTFKDQHSNINQKALQFLRALFYMNFSNLHEVLQRMDSSYLKSLQKIWEKDKTQLLYKQKDQQQKVRNIQYEHLPLIRDLIFGVYQPFVLKNIFSSETKAANKFAVQQFQSKFLQNESVLSKYINLITKIIIRVLPQRHIQIIQLLSHILSMPGISNIINLQPLLQILLPQLGDASVPYRKNVRECFRKLNTNAKNVLQFYNRKLNQIDRNNEEYDWILVYELLQLVIHWMEISQPADCYPPAFNDAVIFSFNKRKTKIPKIQEKCSDFLFNVLQKYPSYRQTLEEVLNQQQMGELQDQIEKKKNYKKLNEQHNKQAKQTFLQEYQQERNRYVKKHNASLR